MMVIDQQDAWHQQALNKHKLFRCVQVKIIRSVEKIPRINPCLQLLFHWEFPLFLWGKLIVIVLHGLSILPELLNIESTESYNTEHKTFPFISMLDFHQNYGSSGISDCGYKVVLWVGHKLIFSFRGLLWLIVCHIYSLQNYDNTLYFKVNSSDQFRLLTLLFQPPKVIFSFYKNNYYVLPMFSFSLSNGD